MRSGGPHWRAPRVGRPHCSKLDPWDPGWESGPLSGPALFLGIWDRDVAARLRQVVAPRYRLAGLPGEYQQRNISGAEVNYCLVTELIVWTQYEIQVAAYNGAGLGVFSRAVTEYTLQGGKGATGGR